MDKNRLHNTTTKPKHSEMQLFLKIFIVYHNNTRYMVYSDYREHLTIMDWEEANAPLCVAKLLEQLPPVPPPVLAEPLPMPVLRLQFGLDKVHDA